MGVEIQGTPSSHPSALACYNKEMDGETSLSVVRRGKAQEVTVFCLRSTQQAEFWTKGKVMLVRLEEVTDIETGVLVDGSKEKVFLWDQGRMWLNWARLDKPAKRVIDSFFCLYVHFKTDSSLDPDVICRSMDGNGLLPRKLPSLWISAHWQLLLSGSIRCHLTITTQL